MLFCDTSALVKLYLREDASDIRKGLIQAPLDQVRRLTEIALNPLTAMLSRTHTKSACASSRHLFFDC